MAKQTVLYVEDEADDVFFMELAFENIGLPGQLAAVSDGDQAIDYMAGHAVYADRDKYPLPSVVLLDLNLPRVPGFEVLKWMRDQPALRDVPVMIFSSSGRAEDRQKATELGASGYLQKPSSGLQFVEMASEIKARWLIPTNGNISQSKRAG